jgi:hypothetical protein
LTTPRTATSPNGSCRPVCCPFRNAGSSCSPQIVAARAGNSVKVLLTVYAKCLADQQDTYNDRISGLLCS